VGFINDHRIVLIHEWIRLDLGEQHAVRHEFDSRLWAGLVIESDFATDFLAVFNIQLFGDTLGNGKGSDSARLRAGDSLGSAPARINAHFWDLGGFAGSCFPGQYDDRMFIDGGDDVVPPFGDGQVARIVYLIR